MAKPVKIASKFTSFHVLVHFYDENNFSILRLRDAVTANSPFFLNEENDLGSWDPSTEVESFFADAVYPAKFLQFGRKYYFNC